MHVLGCGIKKGLFLESVSGKGKKKKKFRKGRWSITLFFLMMIVVILILAVKNKEMLQVQTCSALSIQKHCTTFLCWDVHKHSHTMIRPGDQTTNLLIGGISWATATPGNISIAVPENVCHDGYTSHYSLPEKEQMRKLNMQCHSSECLNHACAYLKI